jgi:hypothetical protein
MIEFAEIVLSGVWTESLQQVASQSEAKDFPKVAAPFQSRFP